MPALRTVEFFMKKQSFSLLIFYAKNVKNTRLNLKTSAWSLCILYMYLYIFYIENIISYV